MQLLGQLWQQSPLTVLVVAGLISFGVYAVVGCVRARPQDEPLAGDAPGEPVRFETIPPGWRDGPSDFT